MNIVTKVPAAYRPADLGQRQRQYLRDRNWIDNRTVGKRPTEHVCLPLYQDGKRCWCGAPIKEKPE